MPIQTHQASPDWSRAWFQKEENPFPSFSPFSCPNSPTLSSLPLPRSHCVFQRVTLGKRRTEGRGKEREGGRDGWREEKREGAEVYSIQHGLLNWFQSSSWTPGMRGTHCRLAVFAFVGCRKSDPRPCSQPTSHIPPITTTENEGSYEDGRPKTGITDTLVIRITNIESECGKVHISLKCWMVTSYHMSCLCYRQELTCLWKVGWHVGSLVSPRLKAL